MKEQARPARPAAIGIALLCLSAFVAGDKAASKDKTNGREKSGSEPFYRKYLVAGDPLDERILDQARRVEAEPESAALRNDFGNLLAQRRFPEQAREQYEKALELDRAEFLAAYNLGLLNETEGRISRAIGAYRKSIARKPGFPHSHFRLGRLYEKRGWERLAVAEYAKALRLDPAMRDSRINPLIVDSTLIDRASLENYERDLAGASLGGGVGYSRAAPGPRPPLDEPLWSDAVEDPASPEPVSSGSAPVPLQTDTRPPRVSTSAQPPMPAPGYELTPGEEELTAPTDASRPPYIGGFRPSPTPTP